MSGIRELVVLSVFRFVFAVIFIIRTRIRCRASCEGPVHRQTSSAQIRVMYEEMDTYRRAMRHMSTYQNKLMNCNRRIGTKIWYFIHHTSQTPSAGNHRFEVSLWNQIISA